MPNVKDIRKVADRFGRPEWHSAIYDYAVDGGATGTYNLLEFDRDCVLVDWYGVVQTTFTGSSSTYNFGYTGALTNFKNNVAVGAMSANAVLNLDGASSGNLKARVTDGQYLTMDIHDAVATAGKLTVHALVGPTYAGD